MQDICQNNNLRNLENQIDSYESLVNEYGFELLDSPERNSIATAYTGLLMNMKEYLNLGVLNGPDLVIMKDMIVDPSSWMTAGSSFLAGAARFFDGDTRSQQQRQKEFFGTQLDQLRKEIQQSRETMLDVYKETGTIPGAVPSYDASQIEGGG